MQFENLKEVIEKRRQGILPSTKVIVEDTAFSDFVSEALESAENSLHEAEEKDIIFDSGIEAEYDFYDILSDQEKLTQLLTDFLHRLEETLPNYSSEALFIHSLDKTTHRYLSIAYPKLKDRGTWEWLDDAFGLEPIFVPEIEETGEQAEEKKKKKKYTVYSYSDNLIGEHTLNHYTLTWRSFDGEVRESLELAFQEVPNFKQEFIDKAKAELDKIGWEVPDGIKLV